MIAQATFDSAIIFFVCFQPLVAENYALHQNTGFPPDMATASVTSFTALIFVVHFNLLTRMKYITLLHGVAIMFTAILPYLVYMWISNYVSPDISDVNSAVLQVHRSPTFYLRVAACIAFSFSLDYAWECWIVIIRGNPTDYLRGIINQGKSVEDPVNRAKFDYLCEIEDDKARLKLS